MTCRLEDRCGGEAQELKFGATAHWSGGWSGSGRAGARTQAVDYQTGQAESSATDRNLGSLGGCRCPPQGWDSGDTTQKLCEVGAKLAAQFIQTTPGISSALMRRALAILQVAVSKMLAVNVIRQLAIKCAPG
jgi:hypothetical protein